MYASSTRGLGSLAAAFPSSMRVDQFGYPNPAGELVPIEWMGGGIHPADPRCTQVLRRYAGFVPDPIDPTQQSTRSYTYDEATGQWGSIAAGAIIACQAVAPLGSEANPVPVGHDPVTSEELRAIMEAPDYQSPTVPGLNDPTIPGYTWGEGGHAVPGYSVDFDTTGAPGVTAPPMVDARGESTDARAGLPTQQEVELWAVTDGAEGVPPGGWGPGGPPAGRAPAAASGSVSPLALAGLALGGLFLFAMPRRKR